MSEETKDQIPEEVKEDESLALLHRDRSDFAKMRELLRAGRQTDVLYEAETQSAGKVAIETFVDQRKDIEVPGEIEVDDEGRVEATLWVSKPFATMEDLDRLAADFVAHLKTTSLAMAFNLDEDTLILEIVSAFGETVQDMVLTFAGPHVQKAIELYDLFFSAQNTDFQA